jgi:hypothetical protein
VIGKLAVAFAVFAWAAPGAHASDIYRCTINGKTTLTDKPCEPSSSAEGSPAPVLNDQVTRPQHGVSQPAIPPGAGAPSLYGTWRGPLQVHMNDGANPNVPTPPVANLIIDTSAAGHVTGTSPELQCRLDGLATPGTGAVMHLDVTFTNCSAPLMNARYNGVMTGSGPVSLQLDAVYTPSLGRIVVVQARSVMRR